MHDLYRLRYCPRRQGLKEKPAGLLAEDRSSLSIISPDGAEPKGEDGYPGRVSGRLTTDDMQMQVSTHPRRCSLETVLELALIGNGDVSP